jgi:hypothetical protein
MARDGLSTSPSHQSRKTALDDSLIKAKKESKLVKIHLPFETEFSGKDCTCKGFVEHVDVYSVLFKIENREIWLSKSYLLAIEIVR